MKLLIYALAALIPLTIAYVLISIGFGLLGVPGAILVGLILFS